MSKILQAAVLSLMGILLVAVIAYADGVEIPGPKVGERFPPLAAADQLGRPQTLKSLMGEQGVALLFVRSADWCPFCMGQLVDANRHLARFRALGLSVVSVSVDEVDKIAAFAKAQNIGYTMLSDPHGDINEKLGIRDPQYPLGSAAFGVPRPTLYVIDRKDVIRLRYQEPTYKTRPNLDGVLRDVEAAGL